LQTDGKIERSFIPTRRNRDASKLKRNKFQHFDASFRARQNDIELRSIAGRL